MVTRKFLILSFCFIVLILVLFLNYVQEKEFDVDLRCFVAEKKKVNYIICNDTGEWKVFFRKLGSWEKDVFGANLKNYKTLTGSEIIKNDLVNIVKHEGGANLHDRLDKYLFEEHKDDVVGILVTDSNDVYLRFNLNFKEYTIHYRLIANGKIEFGRSFYRYNIF